MGDAEPTPAPEGREDRRHGSPPDGDQRDPFPRDRDRILYCSAFRRLAGVSQVVGAAEGHVFHNRLTHSLKAAQAGRRIAERFKGEAGLDVDPEVVEAAALAHDLGHPPFGHAAECELDRLLKADKSPIGEEWIGKTDGFEGNAQTFRILTKLACHRVEYGGLNLTRATLRAVIKYPTYEDEIAPDGRRKWNSYRSEESDFEFAKPPAGQKSNEAQLMEYADDIAYSVHDLEDFFRIGWVPLHRLATDPSELKRFVDAQRSGWSAILNPREATGVVSDIVNEMLPEPLRQPYIGTIEQRSELRRFTSSLIGRYVKAIKIVTEDSGKRVSMPLEFQQEIAVLKQIMVHYVFCNPALAAQQAGHRKVVRELFRTFYEAVHETAASAAAVLPGGLRNLLQTLLEEASSDDERAEIRTRLAVDSVASLTEQEAIALHRRLSGFDGRTVRDPIL